MRDKPSYCYESGCPLAESGKGFVLGTGDPEKAKLALILETLGKDEIAFSLTAPIPPGGRKFLETKEVVEAEIERRKKAYPDIDVALIKRGAPVVGASGAMLNQWVFAPLGIRRDDIFIDNTLRCLPPQQGDKKNYPIGNVRHEAEKYCRHYDRIQMFKPDALVATMHPTALLQEITPLPLLLKDFEKATDFVRAGLRTALLIGGKAAKAFMRYGENISRWRGSYELIPHNWYEALLPKFLGGVKKAKKESKKELFAVASDNDPLAMLDESRLKKYKKGERPQCSALVPKKGQCTKRSQEGSIYCGTHRKKFETLSKVEESNE